MAYKLFTLKNIQAPHFVMTPMELKEYLDFEVKRIYLISSPTGDMKTNQHAHRADEDEVFVQVQGSCTIQVDDGSGLTDIKLEGPKNAIYVPHMVWHGFKDLSDDCIILALTSTNYDSTRSDYIEDYTEFQKLVGANRG
jgi:dTDP-4-dehydrorhamnose 3,5-epimerase-like enzyme